MSTATANHEGAIGDFDQLDTMIDELLVRWEEIRATHNLPALGNADSHETLGDVAWRYRDIGYAIYKAWELSNEMDSCMGPPEQPFECDLCTETFIDF